MTGPRDPVPGTAGQLSERQQHHLEAITTAGEALYEAMHWAEGSSPPGEHQEHDFRMSRMITAALLLELALMLSRKAALETP